MFDLIKNIIRLTIEQAIAYYSSKYGIMIQYCFIILIDFTALRIA